MSCVAGCVSGPVDPSAVSVEESRERGTATERTDRAPEGETRTTASRERTETSEPRRERTTTEPTRDPRSSSSGSSTSSGSSSSTGTSSGSSSASGAGATDAEKLRTQLNEATRELATLRAVNARLSAERSRPTTAAAPTREQPKADPADEKLAASLKSYAQFKQELTTLFTEIERARRENTDLRADLKDAAEQVRQAKASMTRLEDELRGERRSRAEAEKTVSELRDQLRSIARALSTAGLSAEKLGASVEPDSKSRTSGSSSR